MCEIDTNCAWVPELLTVWPRRIVPAGSGNLLNYPMWEYYRPRLHGGIGATVFIHMCRTHDQVSRDAWAASLDADIAEQEATDDYLAANPPHPEARR